MGTISKPIVLDESLKDLSSKIQTLSTKLTPAVDTNMSTVSTNPVQNKVVTTRINAVESSIPYVPKYNQGFGDHQYDVVETTDAAYANLSEGSIGFVKEEYAVPNDSSASTVTPSSIIEVKPKGWKGYENSIVVNNTGVSVADATKTEIATFYINPADASRTGCIVSLIGMIGFDLTLSGATGSVTVSVEDNGTSKFSMTQDYEASGDKIISMSCGIDIATNGNHVIQVFLTISGGTATL